jgi:hypothetical protein
MVATAMEKLQISPRQIQGQLAGGQLPPAGHGSPGAIDLDDVATLPIAVGDIDATGTPSATTYLRGDGAWETPAGGGGGGAPTDAPYVTTAADNDLSAEIVIPGLAASSDRAGVGGGSLALEFESGDTAPTWTAAPTTSTIGATFASHWYIASTDDTERYGYYDWSPGSGAFDARCKIEFAAATDTGSIDFYIADSSNSNRIMLNLYIASRSTNLYAYSYAGSYVQRGSAWGVTPSLYLRISRDGSNNVSFSWSVAGKLWIPIATVSFALTVDRIGVRSANGAHEAAIDWIRASA